MNLISLREYIRNILKKIEVDERNSPYICIFSYHYIILKMTDVVYYYYVSLFDLKLIYAVSFRGIA